LFSTAWVSSRYGHPVAVFGALWKPEAFGSYKIDYREEYPAVFNG
jgi:hypothetical protein